MSIAEKFEVIADEVYEKGKTAHYNEFWESYMKPVRNGEPAQNLFSGTGWNADTFYPKYDIVPKVSATAMFCYFSWWISPYIDLAQRLEDCGIVLDTSKATGVSQMFSAAFVTRLPKISILGATSLDRVFNGAQVLKTIDELELKADGTNTFNNPFGGCTALENIVITGVIGNNGFNVSASTKMTYDSLMSIINALKDYSGSGTTHTVTFGTTNLAKLTDEEKALATQKGWTLA